MWSSRYADCMGTGELDPGLEKRILESMMSCYANTHSDSHSSKVTSALVEEARKAVKKCFVGEDRSDDFAVVFTGQGTTGAARHFAHVLSQTRRRISRIVYTDLEHLSNSAMWDSLFPDAWIDRVPLDDKDKTLFDVHAFKEVLESIASEEESDECCVLVAVTLCSNVFGSVQPVCDVLDEVKRLRERYGVDRFVTCVDCAACAPYVDLKRYLCNLFDAAFASPHKFKGGHSTPGVLVLRRSLVSCDGVPFFPGGGTVWFRDSRCNKFASKVEVREEGGSRNVVGIVRAGVVFERKRRMQDSITARILALVRFADALFAREASRTAGMTLLTAVGKNQKKRLPVYAFTLEGVYPGMFVRALSDFYGIQARGGVSCCFMIAHTLCPMKRSEKAMVLDGRGPPHTFGWIRLSFHDKYSFEDVRSVILDTGRLARSATGGELSRSYKYIECTNSWEPVSQAKKKKEDEKNIASSLFDGMVDHRERYS